MKYDAIIVYGKRPILMEVLTLLAKKGFDNPEWNEKHEKTRSVKIYDNMLMECYNHDCKQENRLYITVTEESLQEGINQILKEFNISFEPQYSIY